MKSSQKQSKFPLTKLPPSIDLTLYLIREELKCQKFFNGLAEAGIEDCYYQPRLGKVILANMGMDDGKDETFEFFYNLVEKRSKKIAMDVESITKQAFRVYNELLAEKKRKGS